MVPRPAGGRRLGRRTVDGRSLFPIYSTGKGIAATAIHLLVQRDTLSWDNRIARSR